MTRLNLLDRDLQSHCTEATQTSTNLEALEKRVAMTEDMLVHSVLRAIRTELQGMTEEIAIVWGKWEEATDKLQEIDIEMETIKAQLLSTTQDWDTKLSIDETLLKKQSGQLERMQST